jgi:N-methylhydantoinase B
MTAADLAIDVILATVIANRVEAITREMGAAMLRSARSPIFAENRDFVTAIFDARLRMVAQTAYIPVLLGSTPFALEAISDYFAGDVEDGDVMILNDPFMGNNHLPDITVVRPVFHQGDLCFWVLTKGHHADVGGGGTAGYNPEARTVWEEGIRITPSRLYRAGTYNRELWTMLLANVRLPFLVEGDLQCQVGATRLAETALLQLVQRYGLPVIDAALEETLARSETQVREQLRAIPDGVYRAERQLDAVGRGPIAQPSVRLALVIDDDTVRFDFEGTDLQVPTYHNSTYANTAASCYNALFSTIDPSIQLNWGSLQPIAVHAPEGTLVHANNGAPTTACTTALCAVIVEAAWQALAQAVPELGQGLWHRQGIAGMSSGQNPRTGKPFAVIHNFSKGGSGAVRGFDGWDHLSPVSSMGGARAPDPELFELRSPHMILNYEYHPDSAGAGTWRGGHGAHYRVRFTDGSTTMALAPSCFSAETAPAGVCGGYAAPTAWAEVTLANGERLAFDGPILFRPQPGDVLDLHSTGGGGYGDPRARPVDAVLGDVRAGLLSPEKATRDYGVVVDPATLAVDRAATAALRGESARSDALEPPAAATPHQNGASDPKSFADTDVLGS